MDAVTLQNKKTMSFLPCDDDFSMNIYENLFEVFTRRSRDLMFTKRSRVCEGINKIVSIYQKIYYNSIDDDTSNTKI